MKCFVDGDQVCIVHDDFVNLQESPTVFVPLGSRLGYELAQSGIEGTSDEAALALLIERRLCLTPVMGNMWVAFPPGGWNEYKIKNASHSIAKTILKGSLAEDEVRRSRDADLGLDEV